MFCWKCHKHKRLDAVGATRWYSTLRFSIFIFYFIINMMRSHFNVQQHTLYMLLLNAKQTKNPVPSFHLNWTISKSSQRGENPFTQFVIRSEIRSVTDSCSAWAAKVSPIFVWLKPLVTHSYSVYICEFFHHPCQLWQHSIHLSNLVTQLHFHRVCQH